MCAASVALAGLCVAGMARMAALKMASVTVVEYVSVDSGLPLFSISMNAWAHLSLMVPPVRRAAGPRGDRLLAVGIQPAPPPHRPATGLLGEVLGARRVRGLERGFVGQAVEAEADADPGVVAALGAEAEVRARPALALLELVGVLPGVDERLLEQDAAPGLVAVTAHRERREPRTRAVREPGLDVVGRG